MHAIKWWQIHLQMNRHAPLWRATERTPQSKSTSSPSVQRTSSKPKNPPERWHLKEAWSCRNKYEMATSAVPDGILNDCDMATESVPKEIENKHRAHRIVYQMASQEAVETTTNRWWPGSHSDSYHCRRSSHGDQHNDREPDRNKPLTESLAERRTEGAKTIADRHSELNAKPPYQWPTKWLPRNKWTFYRSCLGRWLQQATKTLPNAESRDARIRICKAAFREQMRTPITVSSTPYCEAEVSDMDQWNTAHADAISAFYHRPMATSESLETRRLWRCQEWKLTSLPKVMTRRRCNDNEIESIGKPHTTVCQ